MTASPARVSPCASMYSTHAQRAEVGRTSTLPPSAGGARPRAQPREPRLDDVDAGERRCRRAACCAWRRTARGRTRPAGGSPRARLRQRDELVDVVVGLARHAEHHVDLERVAAGASRASSAEREQVLARASSARPRGACARSRRRRRPSACGSRRARAGRRARRRACRRAGSRCRPARPPSTTSRTIARMSG